MITEDYVSFNTAKLLKEKGFNEVCEMFYCKPHEGYLKNHKRDEWWNSDLRKDMTCTCPTLQMAIKWLRKEHGLYIDELLLELEDGDYGYVIQDIATRKYLATSRDNSYQSPEEAAEAAIKYCLENLI